MKDTSMGAIESRFADIIWQNEPITSAELARLAYDALEWKKTTAYTVLRRLCDKGIFENNGGTVRSKISRNSYYSMQSKRFVDDTFGGSLPAFVAAFTAGKKLSESETKELLKLLEDK